MRRLTGSLAILGMLGAVTVQADVVHNDDVLSIGSHCVGQDCVNGEAFGFDTLRLKENNLRIKFDDTSNSASFPNVDWQITANETSNGGLNKFSIDDISNARTPFTIEAGAANNSLYVDDGGRIGFGTANPVVELHTVDGDTPTLRLEQDGSSGFTAQTWDLAGNETNFFVRNVSNGSRLPFRVFPDALGNQLVIGGDGNVGINTASPEANLDVRGQSGASTELRIATTGGGQPGNWQIKRNSATGRLTFFDPEGGATTASFKFDPQAVENLLRLGVAGPDIVDIAGNLNISGDITISGNCTEQNGACADYVFQPEYNLRTLGELEAFIEQNRHLPNVPSADEMQAKGVSLTQMSGRLLEKVEELTLYTLQQQKVIEQLQVEIQDMKDRESQAQSVSLVTTD